MALFDLTGLSGVLERIALALEQMVLLEEIKMRGGRRGLIGRAGSGTPSEESWVGNFSDEARLADELRESEIRKYGGGPLPEGWRYEDPEERA